MLPPPPAPPANESYAYQTPALTGKESLFFVRFQTSLGGVLPGGPEYTAAVTNRLRDRLRWISDGRIVSGDDIQFAGIYLRADSSTGEVSDTLEVDCFFRMSKAAVAVAAAPVAAAAGVKEGAGVAAAAAAAAGVTKALQGAAAGAAGTSTASAGISWGRRRGTYKEWQK